MWNRWRWPLRIICSEAGSLERCIADHLALVRWLLEAWLTGKGILLADRYGCDESDYDPREARSVVYLTGDRGTGECFEANKGHKSTFA
jgi:hypothetical protein